MPVVCTRTKAVFWEHIATAKQGLKFDTFPPIRSGSAAGAGAASRPVSIFRGRERKQTFVRGIGCKEWCPSGVADVR